MIYYLLNILLMNQMNPEEEQKEEEEPAEPLKEQAALCVSERYGIIILITLSYSLCSLTSFCPDLHVTYTGKRSIRKGVCVAVVLCFMVLGVFGALTPASCLYTIHRLFQPYCRIHHTGPPPV